MMTAMKEDIEESSSPLSQADESSSDCSIEEYDVIEPMISSAAAAEVDEEQQAGASQILGTEEEEEEKKTSISSSEYADNPLTHSIGYILALDFWERFAWHGIIFTLPGYLTGTYEPSWNPNYAPFEANSFIATSQAIGFITPFIVAVVADVLVGDYWSINFFTGLCYIPGVILIACASIPHSGGLAPHVEGKFPLGELKIGTHILFPLGFGAAKTMYGVYAAKQYDPIHHADQIEKFFVIFTGVEFLGSFVGAVVSIIVADQLKEPQNGLVIAEFINVGAVSLGLLIFLLGSRRYVKDKLKMRKTYGEMFCSLFEAILCFRCSGSGREGCAAPGFAKTKQSKGGRYNDSVVDGMVQILLLFPVFILIMPTNVAYCQIVVVNITTAAYTKGLGPFKGPLLVATSLLFIGVWAFLIKRFLSPFLQKKGIKLSIADRFALGSFFVACSFAVGVIIDSQIKRVYLETGAQEVSIFYGLFGAFIAGGIVFLFSALNEIAFTMAPAELKMLGTAIMIFMTQGIPNLIGSILYGACAPWFLDSKGNKIQSIEQYVDGNAVYFTYLLMGIALFNMMLMMLPPVKKWISRVEEKSIANNVARAQGRTWRNVGDDDDD